MGNLLNKILNKDYESLTVKELFLMKKYQKNFSSDKQFLQIIINSNWNKNDETELLYLSDEVKNEVIETLKKELLPRTIILENLSKVDLESEGINSNFNYKFTKSLEKLDSFQICKLIDRISHFMKKNSKLNFFGRKSNGDGVYHELNKVISNSLGLNLVFHIFGKKLLNRYMHLPVDRFDKNEFIEVLSKYCIRHTYILEIIANTISEMEVELLEGKKGSNISTNNVRTFFSF